MKEYGVCIEEVRIKPSSAVLCDAFCLLVPCWSPEECAKDMEENKVGRGWCSCQVHASKCCIRAMRTLQVRMSPDMLTAYVLWSAHPECEDAAQHELQCR